MTVLRCAFCLCRVSATTGAHADSVDLEVFSSRASGAYRRTVLMESVYTSLWPVVKLGPGHPDYFDCCQRYTLAGVSRTSLTVYNYASDS